MTERFIHRNGGGLILGHEGGAGSDCRISQGSSISGRTFLSCGTSFSNYTHALDSSISSSALDDCSIVESQIAGAILSNSGIERAVIRGTSKRAVVEGSYLANGVVVEGCRVRDIFLDGPYLLHADLDRTPRHFLMKEEGVMLGVVECGCRPGIKSSVIGCCCRPLDLWIERAELLRRIFQKRGWSGDQIDTFRELFKSWQT